MILYRLLLAMKTFGLPRRVHAQTQPMPHFWHEGVPQRPAWVQLRAAVEIRMIVLSYTTAHQRFGLIHVLAYGMDPPGNS